MTLPWEMKKGMEVEGGDGRRVILTLISFIKSRRKDEREEMIWPVLFGGKLGCQLE